MHSNREKQTNSRKTNYVKQSTRQKISEFCQSLDKVEITGLADRK
jgi:hypothetical protein